jgi:PhzF family phenazine biosynthesis protein
MTIPIYQVDAFTEQRFGGNPAAVCLLREAREEAWMQAVAAEMNLAETSFLVPRGGDYDLRWFTPQVEVDLCGHATLAAAHVLWETKALTPQQPARFHTKSGLLTCTRQGERIAMDFPSKTAVEATAPPELLRALGTRASFTGSNKMDWLVEVDSEATVRALKPDFALLKTIPVRGVIVTARGSGKYDCVSRFFAPRVGIDEDPVTGSAHCCLAPYWGTKLEKKELVAWQASARGGEVRMQWNGDRVVLSGRAVTVLRGELV